MTDIDALLAAERERPGFSSEERAAMWKGIRASVAPAAAASVAAAATTQAATKLGAGKVGALVAVAAIGGAAVGAVAHARFAEPRVVTVERVVTAPPPSMTAVATVAPIPTASVVATHSAAPAPRPSQKAQARDPALARERLLLDMARTALGRGDSAAALSAVDTHAREFPSSQLGEEREVLAIQALASANRTAEAAQRAAAFRKSYPKSPLLPIVEEATR